MSASAAPRSLFARARPLMLARGAGAALSFAIPLVLARAFAPAEYGTYKLLTLLAQTLALVLPWGMAQGLYYFLPRERLRRPYLVQSLLSLLALGALAFCGVQLLAPWAGRALKNPDLAAYAPELGLFTLGLVASMPLEVAQTARGQTRRAAATYLVSDGLKAAVMTLPALAGWGLPGLMLGLSAFGLARVVAAFALLLPGEPGPAFDRGALRRQLVWALPFGAAVLLAVPQQYFHQYVVSAHVDAATFAVYAVGTLQLPVIDLLYTPTSEMLMVRIAELERERRASGAAAVLREAVARLAQLLVPLSVFLMAAAPLFITALFTARYAASVPIFRIAALGALLACLPFDGALRARNQTGPILASYAVKAAFTVPAVLLGVKHFGLLGGVTAWLAAEGVGKVALFARLPRALQCRARDLMPGAQLARIAAASGLAVGGALAASAILGPSAHPWALLVAAALGYGLAYAAALIAMGERLPFGLALLWRKPTSPPVSGPEASEWGQSGPAGVSKVPGKRTEA